MQDPMHAFPTTQWSFIRVAGQAEHDGYRLALEDFLKRYLPALRMHLLVDRRIPRDEAEDFLQGFVTDKVIQDQILSQASQERGRLRNYLLKVLANYLFQQYRSRQAQRRQSRQPTVEWSSAIHEIPQPPFDRCLELFWAQGILQQAIEKMERECQKSHRPEIWVLFDARVIGPMYRDEPPQSYAELVKQHGLKSPSEASNLVITGKRMFLRVLREVVGEYAGDPQSVQEELMDLHRILSRPRAE